MPRRCRTILVLIALVTLTCAARAQDAAKPAPQEQLAAQPPLQPYWWRAPTDRPSLGLEDPWYGSPDLKRPNRPQRYYGWQIFVAFATSDALLVSGITTELAPIIIAGGAGHLFAGPIVHATHGNWGQFGKSLGLTLGLAAGGGLVGLAVGAGLDTGCRAHEICGGKVFMPALVGGSALFAANLADGISLAYEDDDIGSGEPRILLVPSAWSERAGLALAGQF
jgi:hypothetical protein